MQPGRAGTSGLGVPPLPLARLVGWVAPVCPTHGVWILSCLSAALHGHVCALSWPTWLPFTSVPARCVAFCVRCPGPLGSCSPVRPLGALPFSCGVLGHLAPVHRCAAWFVVLRVQCPGPLGSCSPVCPLGALLCSCGVLGHLAPGQRCARSMCCVVCAVSWATWLLFTGVPAPCVVLRVRCPGSFGCCSPVCPLGALLCSCGVLGHLAPVQQCAHSVCRVACAASWATWLLFTGVPAWCVALLVRCPGPLGSCSTVCPRGLLYCVCGVLGHLPPVHPCARSVRCFARAVSWATSLLFNGVPARCAVLRVRCPGPLASCSPVCPLRVVYCVCGVLGHLAPVHRCARSVCCVVLRVRCPGPLCSCSPVCVLRSLLCLCGVLGNLAPVCRCACSVCCVVSAVSWATWLLFTGAPAWCVALRVRCPGPLGSCPLVCPLSVLCCVACAVSSPIGSCSPVCVLRSLLCLCGVLGHLAPVHWCARSVSCVAYAVVSATWLLFNAVPAPCVVLCVRCSGPLGCCSPVCPLGVLCCVCGVVGHLAPVHRCARSVCCVACAVSWAIRLLFTYVAARCVVLCCVCGVLGHLAPVHPCACSVLCFACAVSWATWLLFAGVPARCVVLRLRCLGPLSSCSPVRLLGALLCLCGVLGPLAPVHRCACLVCCVACAVSLAPRFLFTGVPAWCVVLCCNCGVLGHLGPIHRCACSVLCFACAESWATWLLFTGVPARCVVLRVRCPRPLDSCSPLCPLGVWCCVYGVLGPLAAVHRCARSVCCVGCAVSWATWLLFTGVPAWCVAFGVRCHGPLGSCSPVCPLGVLCCLYGVLGPLAPVHRCARSVFCVACTVSWAPWFLFTSVPA